MRAEVKTIEANDIATWPTWEPGHPVDEFQWFTVHIGQPGVSSVDLFQVAVASPQGLKERQMNTSFVGIIVSLFTPEAIEQAIRDVVATVEAPSWHGIAEQLQPPMQWEFAGYRP